jgi:hypothetical protein
VRIAIKLGNVKELISLYYYNGPFKTFELPVKLLSEKILISTLIEQGFSFNIHGFSMYKADAADLLIERSCYYLKLCSELGCSIFILHGLVDSVILNPPDNAQLIEATYKTLNEINKCAIKLQIKCLLENGCYSRYPSCQISEIPSDSFCHIKLAQSLGTGILLDMGHAALSAHWYKQTLNDFLLPYENASFSTDIIHFSDNFLIQDEHLAVGDGLANLFNYRRILTIWPDALMTVENFPNAIYKTLQWLIDHSQNSYEKTDVDNLCRTMGWSFKDYKSES